MSEELRELRISRQLPAREMVSVVKEIYPKYDKTMQSKCERGDEYGIRIRQDALEALYAKFDPEKLKKDKKKEDGHRLKCRISCRYPMRSMLNYSNLSKKKASRLCRIG